jgi:two-component system sensor histidine kinase VanS
MKKTLFRCLRAVVIATVAYAAMIFAVYYIVHNVIIWQPSFLYNILNILEDRVVYILVFVWFVMLFFMIYYYWKKTAGYIEDIAEASKLLIQPDDEDIRLPEELREIENGMNQIKKTALKNEWEARQAEQRKNDLVVNLAHDIRTPLASVIGYLSLLDEARDLSPEQREKLYRRHTRKSRPARTSHRRVFRDHPL